MGLQAQAGLAQGSDARATEPVAAALEAAAGMSFFRSWMCASEAELEQGDTKRLCSAPGRAAEELARMPPQLPPPRRPVAAGRRTRADDLPDFSVSLEDDDDDNAMQASSSSSSSEEDEPRVQHRYAAPSPGAPRHAATLPAKFK